MLAGYKNVSHINISSFLPEAVTPCHAKTMVRDREVKLNYILWKMYKTYSTLLLINKKKCHWTSGDGNGSLEILMIHGLWGLHIRFLPYLFQVQKVCIFRCINTIHISPIRAYFIFYQCSYLYVLNTISVEMLRITMVGTNKL